MKAVFDQEAGGHRWQRVPETEKRGRVQTSTITIAILPEPEDNQIFISDKDLKWSFRRGSGPGGQHRNKTESCVDLVHIPTGIKITIDSRSQYENKILALKLLKTKLFDASNKQILTNRNIDRKSQIGVGMRGDKRRTIRIQDNQVIDHIMNKSMTYDNYSRGNWNWK